MALETATYLADLVTTNPAASDPVGQGDDHLRLLKSVLQNTFPGLGGRFSRVISCSAGYTVLSTDNLGLLNVPVATAGTITHTVSLPALSSITAGFSLILHVPGPSDVAKLTPIGGASVEGSATFNVGPQATGRLFYDGSTWRVQQAPIYSPGGANLSLNGTLSVTGSAFFAATVTISGTAVMAGAAIINGESTLKGNVSIKTTGGTAIGIDLGNVDNQASTPYIDFHSSTDGTNDYDSRIVASGGTTSDGAGNLNIVAGSAQVNGSEIYRRANIVATVSFSGGLGTTPTGGVIERGSNGNGEYVRFADGTQICYQILTQSDIDNASGNVFTSDEILWTYPAAFAAIPEISPRVRDFGSTWAGSGGSTTSTTQCVVQAFRGVTFTGGPYGVEVMAVGRWA